MCQNTGRMGAGEVGNAVQGRIDDPVLLVQIDPSFECPHGVICVKDFPIARAGDQSHSVL